ncbi:MAG: hypothetical protein ACLTSZ_10865 [Lachnospiraceae bacterium]
MLIERNKVVKAKEMYGLDIFGEAIEKARINAQQAGCRIQFLLTGISLPLSMHIYLMRSSLIFHR